MLDIIASLGILTILEIILGVDNLVFIAVTSSRLPPHKQKTARRLGLTFAWMTRLLLLFSVTLIIKLRDPLFVIFDHPFSWRDLILIFGGLFLLFKGTREIHSEIEAVSSNSIKKYTNFIAVIMQIGILDIIFSLDSVMVAVGLTPHFWIMATAITIAIIVMVFASEPLSRFIQLHPTFRMLAFSFLLMIGTILIADGFGFDVPRGYIYFAVCFSLLVEFLNVWAKEKKRQSKRV